MATRHHRLSLRLRRALSAHATGDRGTVPERNQRCEDRGNKLLTTWPKARGESSIPPILPDSGNHFNAIGVEIPLPLRMFSATLGLAKFSFSSFCLGSVPVAQPDRASDFGSEGWGFESLQARHTTWPIMVPRRRTGLATLLQYPAIVTGRRSESDFSIFSDIALRLHLSWPSMHWTARRIDAAKAVRSRQTGDLGNSFASCSSNCTLILLVNKKQDMTRARQLWARDKIEQTLITFPRGHVPPL